jgi:hypothetical protein
LWGGHPARPQSETGKDAHPTRWRIFKSNFATFGEGNFTINYDLVGSDANSFATFNNAKLALEVPEPTTTVAGFVALALAAGAMQRKRRTVNGIKVNP